MGVTSFPVEGLSPAQQAQFEGLRGRFAQGLALRWHDISQADRLAQAALLHRLCGSAGSFGFDRLGQLARQAEALCASDDAAALTACLALLEAEISAAVASVSKAV